MSGRDAWTRIWTVSRRQGVEEGLRARVADPAWMLARQWQFGAFHGDDAASPVRLEVKHRTHNLDEVRGVSGQWKGVPEGASPEIMVEPFAPETGAAAARHSHEAGLQFLRLFERHERAEMARFLRRVLRNAATPPRGEDPTGLLALLRQRSFPGHALAARSPFKDSVLADDSPLPSRRVETALREWRSYYHERFTKRMTAPSWRGDKQSYGLQVRTQQPSARRITLEAPRHDGDRLDWMCMDFSRAKSPGAQKAFGLQRRNELFPVPIRYSGMPADRFWDMEEGQVNFGGLSAQKTDLAQMILTEFATVYSNDWFMVPTQVKAGSLTRIETIRVWDTFGEVHDVTSLRAAEPDAARWRVFELTGDPSAKQKKTPWLYIPRAVVGADIGPVLEEVIFSRDEMANLAWGIETRVERADGSVADRAQNWQSVRNEVAPPNDPRPGQDDAWRYRLVTPVPPHWVPFVPEVEKAMATGRLRRARLPDWELLDEDVMRRFAGVQGEIMEPHHPFALDDSEVPEGGISVVARFESARGVDGTRYVWLARRRGLAPPVPGSGRKTDWIETEGGDT